MWYNPFNRQKMYVSFARCRVVVFWTKNPKPILPYLHELDERGIHYYFQGTLNDYADEFFELQSNFVILRKTQWIWEKIR